MLSWGPLSQRCTQRLRHGAGGVTLANLFGGESLRPETSTESTAGSKEELRALARVASFPSLGAAPVFFFLFFSGLIFRHPKLGSKHPSLVVWYSNFCAVWNEASLAGPFFRTPRPYQEVRGVEKRAALNACCRLAKT